MRVLEMRRRLCVAGVFKRPSDGAHVHVDRETRHREEATYAIRSHACFLPKARTLGIVHGP